MPATTTSHAKKFLSQSQNNNITKSLKAIAMRVKIIEVKILVRIISHPHLTTLIRLPQSPVLLSTAPYSNNLQPTKKANILGQSSLTKSLHHLQPKSKNPIFRHLSRSSIGSTSIGSAKCSRRQVSLQSRGRLNCSVIVAQSHQVRPCRLASRLCQERHLALAYSQLSARPHF